MQKNNFKIPTANFQPQLDEKLVKSQTEERSL